MNALYTINTISPNGQVRRDVLVAARSGGEAEVYLRQHELWGRDGYSIGVAHLVGDLDDNHKAKYAVVPMLVGAGVAV